MKKQKISKKLLQYTALLRRRRSGWFALLLIGLLVIQFAYNVHAGEPRVLGYSSQISQAELLLKTNEYRTSNGLKSLTLNDQLNGAAQAKAEDMVRQNYWGHVSPDGTTPWRYFEQKQYAYKVAGENLAYGFTDSSETVAAWMNSESHKANVLGDYAAAGFGVVRANYQGGDNVLVVAFYATPTSDANTAGSGTNPANLLSPAQQVHGLAVVATGGAPWAIYASLALLGATTIGFIVTHLELLRGGWYRGRRFLVLHPALDMAIILVLAFTLIYTAGGFIH